MKIYRLRKCNIFYYLDDDTIHIDEIREENLGITEGYFIKNKDVKKKDKKEFILLGEILIYRKKYFYLGKNF